MVSYEREMKIYEDVWPKLAHLREAVLSLRPIMDSSLKEGETTEDRKRERAIVYSTANNAFSKAVEHNRPFYPSEIWIELRKLLDLGWHEAVEYRFTDQSGDWGKCWDDAMNNSKACFNPLRG